MTNTQYPQRPRQHQLQTESRQALERSVPIEWVVRHTQNDDLGVDGEIEIVGQDGGARGSKFTFQLKGTDEPILADALGVRLRTTTYRYLLGQAVPACLVLYHAPTGRLFGNWVHAFRVGPGPEQQTITLRLAESDELVPVAFEQLERDLAAHTAWKSADPPLPLQIDVRTEEPLPSATAPALAREFAAHFSSVQELISFSAATSDGQFISALVSRDWVRVSVLDFASFKWTHNHPDDVTEQALAATVQLMISLLLDRTGKESLANRFLSPAVLASPLIAEFGVGLTVGAILGFDRNAQRAVGMARSVLGRGASGYDVACGIVTGFASVLSEADLHDPDISQHLIEHYDTLLANGSANSVNTAAANYSYAKILFAAGRYRDSLHQFRLAATNDPTYRKRSYWLAETAAALFENGRYLCSARFYQQAMECEEQAHDYRPGRADALLFAGCFSEALTLFEEYLEDADEVAPWWLLKAAALGNVLDPEMFPDQPRNPAGAQEVLDRVSDDALAEDVADKALAALQLDPLSHQAWMMLAVASLEVHGRDHSHGASMAAIATDPSCVECCLRAVQLTLGREDSAALLPLVLGTCYRTIGPVIFDELRADIAAQLGHLPDEVDVALAQLEGGLQSVRDQGPPQIRIVDRPT